MTIDVKALVADRLLQLAPSVTNSVIEQLAGAEHSRRISAFLFVVDEIDKAVMEIRKIKPVVQYDYDGKEQTSSYTKEQIEAKKKLDERVAKLNKAIDATEATPPDFSKILEIAKL